MKEGALRGSGGGVWGEGDVKLLIHATLCGGASCVCRWGGEVKNKRGRERERETQRERKRGRDRQTQREREQ